MLSKLDQLNQNAQILIHADEDTSVAMLQYNQSYEDLLHHVNLLLKSNAKTSEQEIVLHRIKLNLESLQEIIVCSQNLISNVRIVKNNFIETQQLKVRLLE